MPSFGAAPIRRAQLALGPLAAALLLLHVGHYLSTWTDDAYITFRYARRFAAGLGMTFNDGEHVEGLTNLGWALVLAPFAGGDLLTAAQVLGVLAAVATVGFLAAWARDAGLGFVATGIALATFVLPPWVPHWTVQGLETPAVMLLLTIGWSRYATELREPRRWLLAAPALGLAPWLRPDAALLPILLGAWHLRGGGGDRRRVAISVGIVAMLGVLLVAVKLAWFGEILPNPFHVKVDQFPPDRGLAYLWSFLTLPSPWLPLALTTTVGVSGLWAWNGDRRAIPGVVFGAWVLAAVLENGDFMANFRLLVPAWPAACAALGLAVQALIARVPARVAPIAGIALAAIAGPVLYPQANAYFLDGLNRNKGEAQQNILPARIEAPLVTPWKSPHWTAFPTGQVPFPTAWALVNAGPTDTLAYTELGLISYVNDHPVVDLLGLTDRVLSGRDGETWAEQWPYIAGRASWLFVNTEAGAWPRLKPSLAEAGWTAVDGCGPTWAFANPALPGAAPDAAELARRLAQVLERAPRHTTLLEAIARELAHSKAPTATISNFLHAAEALGMPRDEDLRCDVGLGASCPVSDTCDSDQARAPQRWMASADQWPDIPEAARPPGLPAAPDALPPDAKGTPEAATGPPTPQGPLPACSNARERAAAAWADARTAWSGPEADAPRRGARVAARAAHAGGAEALASARTAAADASASFANDPGRAAAHGASVAALAASEAAAEVCGE
ncbi:MAG: hypothetical protein V4850_22670 [Myxococcota bacterium]